MPNIPHPEVSNNQMELSKFNSDATYGCPIGLSTDPDPLYEVYISTSSVLLSSATFSNGGHSASFSHPTSAQSSRPTSTPSISSTPDRGESLASSLSTCYCIMHVCILSI